MRVLVVDDDRDIRNALRMILEDEGYTVVEADDGTSAFRLLAADPEPFVVILDNKMQRMDGMLLLQAIDQQPTLARHRAFILMTGVPNSGELVAPYRGRLHVCTIDKPFTVTDLIAEVQRSQDAITAPVIANDTPDLEAMD